MSEIAEQLGFRFAVEMKVSKVGLTAVVVARLFPRAKGLSPGGENLSHRRTLNGPRRATGGPLDGRTLGGREPGDQLHGR